MTVTLEKTPAQILGWVLTEYLDTLNAKEVTRREEVNARHLAEYGRLLYPEGGQATTFSVAKGGRKYLKVVQESGGQTSVHAFIAMDGGVYKPAGWRAPAPGERYNLLDAESRARLFDRCEFTGWYLYAGRNL
jgi:hypothetical protein